MKQYETFVLNENVNNDQIMNCEFLEIKKDQLPKISKLWQQLNEIHRNDSNNFKDYYNNNSFEKRCEKFINIPDNNIKIEIIEDNEIPIGYCISTIEKNVGEIDSLFIEQQYRKFGYGHQLVASSIKWIKKNNCKRIIVAVADGHESVFEFYKKFGLYPKLTYLEME